MKYTSPIYSSEAVETKDVICTSLYRVIEREETSTDENGNQVTKKITQISVNMSKIF